MSSRRENAVETDNEKHNKCLLKKAAHHLVKNLPAYVQESAKHQQLRNKIINACHEDRDWIVTFCHCENGTGSLAPRGRAPPGCKHVVMKMLQEAIVYLKQMIDDNRHHARESRNLAQGWFLDATMQSGGVPEADPAVCLAVIVQESDEDSECFDEERNCELLQQAARRIVHHIPSALRHQERQKLLTDSLESAFTMSERLRVSWCGCRTPSGEIMHHGCRHQVTTQLEWSAEFFRTSEKKMAKDVEAHRAQAFSWWVAAGGVQRVPEPEL